MRTLASQMTAIWEVVITSYVFIELMNELQCVDVGGGGLSNVSNAQFL